jgi:hypothetical protein
MSELQKLCEQKHVRIKAVYGGVEPSPRFPAGHHPYKITLRYKGRQLTVPFFCGPAITREPSAADVLSCLISDGQCYENTEDIDEFHREFGGDSIKETLRAYTACEKMSKKIKDFLGDDYELFANAEY